MITADRSAAGSRQRKKLRQQRPGRRLVGGETADSILLYAGEQAGSQPLPAPQADR